MSEEEKIEEDKGGSDDEMVGRARRLGWIEEGEFTDDMVNKPKKFLSAKEYVEKVESNIPVLRERNRFLDDTVVKLEQKLGDASGQLKTTNEKLEHLDELVMSLHEQNKEIGVRAFEKAKRELDVQIDQAIDDGDKDSARQLMAERDDLQKPPAEPAKKEPETKKPEATSSETPAAETQLSPVASKWISENKDIMDDAVMNPVAVSLHTSNMSRGMSEMDSLISVRSEIRKRFSDKFTNANRSDPAAVGESSPPADSGGKSKKGFDSLPDTAKKTYESLRQRYEAKGRKYSREDYAKDYHYELEARA